MLQTMVSLVDVERTIHVQVHEGLVDIALAALSAEPVTIDELRAAMARYVEPDVVEHFFDQAGEGLASRSTEGGHLIIDFTACLVANSTCVPELPRLGNVLSCDQQTTLDLWLPYRIPEQWQLIADTRRWQEVAERRRPQFADRAPCDAREVLYAKLPAALLDRFLETRGLASGSAEAIHDWWLLTPREDLTGQSPRDVLLARHQAVDGDVQDQAEIWSLLGRCPPGLSARSHAYRRGGFGTHEIVLYHELASILLREIECRVGVQPEVDRSLEICHLEQLQQEWLHQPQTELYDQSPAALIARERARLPAVIPKGHEHLDHDCPLCRMMADSDQPMIWQLDSYPLEARFATSFCKSRAEWERRQHESDDVEVARTCAPIAATCAPGNHADDKRIWSNSFTNMEGLSEMPDWASVNVMLFAIGGHLAEVVQDLRRAPDTEKLVQLLHVRFDDMRVCVREQRDLMVLQSSIAEFIDALQSVWQAHDELGEKCMDLEKKLDFLQYRYARHLDRDLETPY
ncbi:MAG: hypothetical protein ACYC6N_15570 [Pirellulaceae bacterium]